MGMPRRLHPWLLTLGSIVGAVTWLGTACAVPPSARPPGAPDEDPAARPAPEGSPDDDDDDDDGDGAADDGAADDGAADDGDDAMDGGDGAVPGGDAGGVAGPDAGVWGDAGGADAGEDDGAGVDAGPAGDDDEVGTDAGQSVVDGGSAAVDDAGNAGPVDAGDADAGFADANDAGFVVVTWSEDVWPLVAASCTGCHGAAAPAAGMDLSSSSAARASLVGASSSCGMMRVEPFAPDGSFLVHKLAGTHDAMCGARMPRDAAPWSDASVDLVRAWIGNGALDD